MPYFGLHINVKWECHSCCCIEFYCELEHALLVIKITSIQELLHHNIFQIHLVGFVIIKTILRISRCLAKDTSFSNCKKYDKYTIPRTSMTPWVGNLISNSLIKFFPAPIKLHTNHVFA